MSENNDQTPPADISQPPSAAAEATEALRGVSDQATEALGDAANQAPETPAAPPAPIVLGDMLPQEMGQITELKQQADQIVHQIGVNSVQEHRMIDQLRQVENATNGIVASAGKRLGIPEGTAWSVTSEGKAVLAGPPQAGPGQPGPPPLAPPPPQAPAPQAPVATLVPDPPPEDEGGGGGEGDPALDG